MNTKKIMLPLIMFTSLSCIAAPQTTQPINSPTPEPTSSRSSASEPTDAPQNPQQGTVEKPSMADYCKEHTC